jgi:hypothetical protein
VITNALYDGLKRFLRPGKSTIFQFYVERKDKSEVTAWLETDDPDVLRHVISAFDRLVNPNQLNEWDEHEQMWKQLQQRSGVSQLRPTESPMGKSAADAELADWIQKLGITGRLTGQVQARASWNALISAGRTVLGTGSDYTVEHLVFSGFLARAQGLHEAAVAAISANNPYAAFTLLRAYAENTAAILYVKDHPADLDKFWRDICDPGVELGEITNHAMSRFGGFKGVYSELSRYAHPQALSLLASTQVIEGQVIQWSSAPAFKSDHDAVMACVWVVELAEATSHLLMEFAAQFGLLGRSHEG